jgi:hypothetical protein
MATYKASWAARAGFKRLIIEGCFLYDLEYRIDVEKGFIREIGVFKVTGTDENVLKFKDYLDRAMELYYL